MQHGITIQATELIREKKVGRKLCETFECEHKGNNMIMSKDLRWLLAYRVRINKI